MSSFTFINCILNVPLMLACVTGNSLTLSAILRTPSLRSPSNIFMCSLAISDLLVGIIVQPVYIAYELKQEPPLTFAINVLFSFTGVVSLCTMTAISVDRFMALQFHLRYQCLMTEKRAMYTSLSLWLFGILSSFVTLWNKTIMFAFLAVGIAICIFISTFSYTRIYLIVRQHQFQIRAQQQALQLPMNLVRTKRSAISTFIYYICMILCYTPMFSFMSIVAIRPGLSGLMVWKVGNTFVFMNSSINPILFCWRVRVLRRAVLKLVRPRHIIQTSTG